MSHIHTTSYTQVRPHTSNGRVLGDYIDHYCSCGHLIKTTYQAA